ncbi:MAG: flippase [Clostridia bacterium]|nr:flippase [Clostridia bacterium]
MSSQNGKYKKLAKNTVVFMVGNFGSKLISFVIVPLYTYVLTTEEYGIIDLFTTTINLILPFMILGLNEAVLRFLAGKEMKKETVASDCFVVFLLNSLIVWALYPLYSGLPALGEHAFLFTVLLTVMAFNQVFLQYLRGNGQTVAFAMNGIIITAVTVLANLFFLLYLKMGIKGYLLAFIIAQLCSAVEIIFASKLWRDIRFKHINKKMLREMLSYCLPLIPGSLMWWVMNAGDKYMINYFIDASANGIYSVAHKFPTIINMFYAVFMQAWQLSAIEEKKSDSSSGFHSNVYRYILAVLAIVGSGIILVSKPLYLYVMESEFKIAWQSVPLLIIAQVFSCLTGFFGTVYVVEKKTKKALITTMCGAIANLAFNLVLIPKFGLIGAAAGTMLGYTVAASMRMLDTKKYINIDLKIKKVLPAVAVLLMQTGFLFADLGVWVYIIQVICMAVELIIFKAEVSLVFSFSCSFIKNKLFKSKRMG